MEREPLLYRWEECRRSIHWPEPSKWGFHFGRYREVVFGSVHGNVVLVPSGQASTSLSSSVETLILGVTGESEFHVGSGGYVLKPYDILILGPRTSYTFKNVGLTSATFFQYSARTTSSEAQARGTESRSETDAGASVTHVPWEEYRREFHWGLPLADTWGSHRASGPHLKLQTLMGHLVRHPVGQSNPWHDAGGNGSEGVGVLLMQGESEFDAAGRTWPLKPLDLQIGRAHV